jgi:hypothetical protein
MLRIRDAVSAAKSSTLEAQNGKLNVCGGILDEQDVDVLDLRWALIRPRPRRDGADQVA